MTVAAHSVCSPPPCGEGLGVGVVVISLGSSRAQRRCSRRCEGAIATCAAARFDYASSDLLLVAGGHVVVSLLRPPPPTPPHKGEGSRPRLQLELTPSRRDERSIASGAAGSSPAGARTRPVWYRTRRIRPLWLFRARRQAHAPTARSRGC